MNGQDPLAQLHDIHMPAAIGWWPPAPGWWMLAAFMLCALVGLLTWLWLRHRSLAYKREALTELQSIQTRYLKDKNDETLLTEISVLLKRICITRYGREQTAGLTGEQWLQFLNQTGKSEAFTQGAGRVLVEQRYVASPRIDGSALLKVAQEWLKKQ